LPVVRDNTRVCLVGQSEGVTSQGKRETNAMREVAVMGSGQARLQMALRLLKNNYQVTVVRDRPAEQIFNRRVTSSQFMALDSQNLECV
jgi:hypothetical protein